MALTAQEQAELNQLQGEAAQTSQPAGLTPQEQQELTGLQAEAASHAQSTQSQEQSNYLQKQKLASDNRQDLVDTAQAGLTGVARGATLGLLPQIVAGSSKAIDYLTPKSNVDKQLEAQGFNVQNAPDKTYTQYRDEQALEQQKQQEAHPVATLAGEALGSLVPLAASPFGALSKGASFGSKLAHGAATGGALGLLTNPGETPGEVSPFQPVERLKAAGLGAILGPAVEIGAKGASKIGSKMVTAGQDLAAIAEEKAFKALGPTAKDMAEKFKTKGGNLGRFILDHALIKPGDRVQDIAERALETKNTVGESIGNIYRDAGAMAEGVPGTKINLKEMSDDFLAGLEQRQFGNPEEEQTINHVSKVLKNISKKGEVSLAEAHKTRGQLDGMIKWGKTSGTIEPEKLAEMKNLRNELQARMEDSLKATDEAIGTSFHADVKDLNKQYGPLKDIAAIGQKGAGRAGAARTFGASEQIATAAGLVSGGPVTAVKLAVGSGIIKRYSDPIVSIAANKVAQILEANPQGLGKYGGALIKAAEDSPDAFIGALTLAVKNPVFKRKIELKENDKFQRSGQ